VNQLVLSERVRVEMLSHARSIVPNEAVGLLAADAAGRVAAVAPLPNVVTRPGGYLADPIAQFRAERQLAKAGLTPVAVYHSHPHGRSDPSPSDRMLARSDRLLHVILGIDAANGTTEIRAYALVNGDFVEVDVV
jgi:proteasome lid subunit RPN8/RPN11